AHGGGLTRRGAGAGFLRLHRDIEAHAEHEETGELARLPGDQGRDSLVPVGEVFRNARGTVSAPGRGDPTSAGV
ncbi:MAG: hypothetical protein ACTHJ6_06160, partial [Oryzihumus sp.]